MNCAFSRILCCCGVMGGVQSFSKHSAETSSLSDAPPETLFDVVAALPPSLSHHVLSLLSVDDLVNSLAVSVCWRNLSLEFFSSSKGKDHPGHRVTARVLRLCDAYAGKPRDNALRRLLQCVAEGLDDSPASSASVLLLRQLLSCASREPGFFRASG